MTTYRVPVQLRDVPGPGAAPVFLDVKDFWFQLVDALGTFARIGASFDSDLSVDAVKPVDDLRHNVYVTIQDPNKVTVLEGERVTGEARRAAGWSSAPLVQIETAKVDDRWNRGVAGSSRDLSLRKGPTLGGIAGSLMVAS